MTTNESDLSAQATTSQAPLLSVVMGVHDGAALIAETIDSILSQSFQDFELIVVDDGSTDQTREILNKYAAADARIVVLAQAQTGLTRALIAGSELARGEFIARHDAGDRSLPDRFQKQIDLLRSADAIAAVGAGLRRVGPGGEFLGDTVRRMTPGDVTADFLRNGIGLSHPASMFRRAAFRSAGGYRSEFRYAQDTDLWYRISRYGQLAEVDEVLVELRIDTDGISPQNSDRQKLLADLARASYDARSRGEDDGPILQQATHVSWQPLPGDQPRSKRIAKANAEHFIGSQLYALGDHRCRNYFARAIKQRPFWSRPWLKLFLSFGTTTSPSKLDSNRPAVMSPPHSGQQPNAIERTIGRIARFRRLAGCRLRAKKLSWAGLQAGSKINIGKRTRIDHPWRVSIGSRATLEQDVWFKLVDDQATVEIGEFTFIGRGTELDVAQQIRIGANVLIAPRVFITDHSHNIAAEQAINSQGCESAPIQIGDDVWIGTNVVILPGVTIGHGAVIGAGAVVRGDVPDFEIWAGVPARRIRQRQN